MIIQASDYMLRPRRFNEGQNTGGTDRSNFFRGGTLPPAILAPPIPPQAPIRQVQTTRIETALPQWVWIVVMVAAGYFVYRLVRGGRYAYREGGKYVRAVKKIKAAPGWDAL